MKNKKEKLYAIYSDFSDEFVSELLTGQEELKSALNLLDVDDVPSPTVYELKVADIRTTHLKCYTLDK